MSDVVGYSRTQIRLHWVVFALVVLQFVLHEPIAHAWHAVMRGEEFVFHPLILGHVVGGILVLAFAIWRLVLRMRRGAPPAPGAEKPAAKMVAKGVHVGLYALMVLMPISGAAAWFGGIGQAAEAHEILKALLLALVALHVVGALYHQFVLKTNLLNRMRQPVE